MPSTLHPDAVQSIVDGGHGAPFEVFGIHDAGEGRVVVRSFRPAAQSVTVVLSGDERRYPMERVHRDGLYEVSFEGSTALRYEYDVVYYDDQQQREADPYRFLPQITDYDLYLLGEGRHLESYEKLGAHPVVIDGVSGTNFVVWAPTAHRVSVIGDFNRWDERVHPMRRHPSIGLWELFVPGVQHGDLYRYDINSMNQGYRVKKSDPYAFYAERRPSNASIVYDLDGYAWNDTAWMQQRAQTDHLKSPMSVYELHLGSWMRDSEGRWLSYREMTPKLVDYIKDLGYTHVELMPAAEHPFDGSWGYQVTGYFAVTSRYGDPKDFMYFVDTCHQHGIGVILDWVPAHFPKDVHGLGYFDGTHLYEHADPRQGEHPDWGTYIFNFGRNEVRNFLLSNALFWLRKYHIDGLRVDAVSSMIYLDFSREDGEWIPNEYGGNENLPAISFLKEFNELVHKEAPGAITIAEESTAWTMVSRPTYVGGLGFTFKWNMGWMHDTLQYFSKDPVYRRWEHNKITFSMLYAFTENFVLSLSHDEVVHGKGSLINKMSGDWWQKFAGLRMLYGFMYAHPGKKLLFMGQEFGQWREWSEGRALDWDLLQWPTHQKLQRFMRDLNAFYKSQPALYEQDFSGDGFQWIDANDADNSVFSFIRYAEDRSDFLVAVMNATPVVREDYKIGVPEAGFYREVLNSDSEYYGGSNVGNDGGVQATEENWHGWPYSLTLRLPPLGFTVFKLDRDDAGSRAITASADRAITLSVE